ncbi:hypothetical protein FJR06_00835 [Dolichospermum sp. UHCC 0352]|uniref:hypothetical protein n=1 Tax=Dolichospermum sp. UHCC 0352 TaxID=2590011 RepID=UPI001447C0B0|nr:hypothetical protein [Dolichospermum sp. UHCC 0352]MTJ19958.1 hypothetical protein [Dolichospermum sp. UHCC 0352]
MDQVIPLVEQFQQLIDKMNRLMEDAKTLSGELPDTGLSEVPAKMKTIFELCEEGRSCLNESVSTAEVIQKLLGA